MQTALAIKRFGALRPADEQAEAEFRALADGETVRLEWTRPARRSIRHHRMFFGLLNVTAEQVGWTTDQLLTWCKVAVGHCDAIVEPRTGEVTMIPKSISFARMDQKAFNDFFDKAMTAILERLMPAGTQRDELVEEVMARIGERAAA